MNSGCGKRKWSTDLKGKSICRVADFVESHKPNSYHHSVTKSKSRTRPEEKGGGILADEMGMGKSLSILSLIIETLEDGQRWAETQRLVEEPRHVKAHTPSTLIVVSSAREYIFFSSAKDDN